MGRHLTEDDRTALFYGTHQVRLRTESGFGNPYLDLDLAVVFTRPDSSEVRVDGFYDGGDDLVARAYCDAVGTWSWRSESSRPDLAGKTGSFRVVPSRLKGKLSLHPDDPTQFAYADGSWFLHIGDTGYRYVVDDEMNWREYLEQAVAAGFTKIRTWFSRARCDCQALFQHDGKYGRVRLNLPYWQEIDRRLVYALEHYPEVIFQLIPFGEDGDEIRRYGDGDELSRCMIRYAQARFSAFSNIHWCISNDHRIIDDDAAEDISREGNPRARWGHIDTIARDMARREPWGTLLTNHQMRFSGYSFLECDWSDIVTIEDLGQVTGDVVLKYRSQSKKPVVLDEDRYECWRPPQHDRYFFRRLMWATLLSGGHPTYGGLMTFESYDGGSKGMRGYYDACDMGLLESGAHDFRYIHRFFSDTGLSCVGMEPADQITEGPPVLYKAMRDKTETTFIVYLANPDMWEGHAPDGFGGVHTDEAADVRSSTPSVVLTISDGEYSAAWFCPSSGEWRGHDTLTVTEKKVALTAPDTGDWTLLLRRCLQ